MITRNLLLGVFVILIVAFASLAVSEYYMINSQFHNQSTSTTLLTSSPASCLPSNTTCGSFTYNPTGQVYVLSVQATESPSKNGRQNVTFSVTYENVGNSPIYAIGGWVSALSSTIIANSTVLQQVSALRCAGAIYTVTLKHGQNYTVHAPDCGTGFSYQLVHSGSINVVLGFNWTTDKQETTPFSNSTTVSAQFVFP